MNVRTYEPIPIRCFYYHYLFNYLCPRYECSLVRANQSWAEQLGTHWLSRAWCMYRDMTEVNRHLKFLHFSCIIQFYLVICVNIQLFLCRNEFLGLVWQLTMPRTQGEHKLSDFQRPNCWAFRRWSQPASDSSEPWHSALYSQLGDCAIHQREQGIHSFPFWSTWALRKESSSCQTVQWENSPLQGSRCCRGGPR